MEENPVPLPLSIPQNLHGAAWDRNQASAVRSRWLTDRAITVATVTVTNQPTNQPIKNQRANWGRFSFSLAIPALTASLDSVTDTLNCTGIALTLTSFPSRLKTSTWANSGPLLKSNRPLWDCNGRKGVKTSYDDDDLVQAYRVRMGTEFALSRTLRWLNCQRYCSRKVTSERTGTDALMLVAYRQKGPFLNEISICNTESLMLQTRCRVNLFYKVQSFMLLCYVMASRLAWSTFHHMDKRAVCRITVWLVNCASACDPCLYWQNKLTAVPSHNEEGSTDRTTILTGQT